MRPPRARAGPHHRAANANKASSTAAGCSVIKEWPASTWTIEAWPIAVVSNLVERAGVIMSLLPKMNRAGQAAARRRLAVRIGIAGGKIGMKQLLRVDRRHALHQPARAAHGAHAGQRTCRVLRAHRMRPDVDHVDRRSLVVFRRLEQRLRHPHRIGRAQHAKLADARRRLKRGLERDQRAHAVPDQHRARDASRVQQGQQPGGHRLDSRFRRALAAAVARQVERQYIEAVMGKIAGLQNPHRMVVLGAVNKHHGRQRRVEILAAGVAIGGIAFDVEHHVRRLSATF